MLFEAALGGWRCFFFHVGEGAQNLKPPVCDRAISDTSFRVQKSYCSGSWLFAQNGCTSYTLVLSDFHWEMDDLHEGN